MKMEKLHEVKLELLRAGPMHNQLLSPLTPYLILCGNGGPVTFNIPMEHRELLNRLERLRYVFFDGQTKQLDDRMREAELEELGRFVGNILGNIKTLNSELSQTKLDQGQGIHLRLVLSGSELSLIPFELSISPLGLPGEGLPLLLQKHLPITITREARRIPPSDMEWIRFPRLLFVSAAPGTPAVPTEGHCKAIRNALEPWIRWEADPEKRINHVSDRLTVINNASLAQIRESCAVNRYTHVHILAHGSHYERAGERRYGVALCDEKNPSHMDVVSGERLAQALRASQSENYICSNPTVVTLMTCDSGNQASVVSPGGSIAHDLHAYGIPWVFASQFPLTIPGSILITRAFYEAIFRGDDPRCILHALRNMLRASSEKNHDWASLVAYATIPEDFSQLLLIFREKQRRKAIDIAFDKAERIATCQNEGGTSTDDETDDVFMEQFDLAINVVRRHMVEWGKELPQLEKEGNKQLWSEFFGMRGAIEKRIGLLHSKLGNQEKAKSELEQALKYYKHAFEIDFANHWTASQIISLCLVLNQKVDNDVLIVAHCGAERDLRSHSVKNQAWAHGTLAELTMLSLVLPPIPDTVKIKKKVVEHCYRMMELAGEYSFHVYSTRRQFKRYLLYWKRVEWKPIAEAAFNALGGEKGDCLFELPPDPYGN